MIAFTDVIPAAAAAPTISLHGLTGTGDVLVLAPHPDDESLAMGGAIAAACRAGRRVTVAIVTDGARSHPNSTSHPGPALASLRRSEVTQAVQILSDRRAELIWLGYPDLAAPENTGDFAAVEGRLSRVLGSVTAIWTTWNGDPHPDHQRVWRLARYLAARRERCQLYACPVWGRVQGPADGASLAGMRRFPTRQFQHLKAQAVAAHASQMTRLINDDPEGFMMPPELADHFIKSDEIFIPS